MRTIRINKWFFSVALLFVLHSTGWAQADIINDVKEALKLGSSKEVVKFVGQNIDLTIDTKMETYSKTQADLVLKDFFKKNPPASFVIVHQGSSKGGSPYATGQYTSNGNTFLVWVRIKKHSEKFIISEMSFIKE